MGEPPIGYGVKPTTKRPERVGDIDLTPCREMTLAEVVDTCPPVHGARRELAALRAENAALRARLDVMREAWGRGNDLSWHAGMEGMYALQALDAAIINAALSGEEDTDAES